MPVRRLAPSLKQSTGLFFNARPGGVPICADLFVVGCELGVINCYCWPPRRLVPWLKQSTGLFFNARPPKSSKADARELGFKSINK